jgi:hypothetical protein
MSDDFACRGEAIAAGHMIIAPEMGESRTIVKIRKETGKPFQNWGKNGRIEHNKQQSPPIGADRRAAGDSQNLAFLRRNPIVHGFRYHGFGGLLHMSDTTTLTYC